MRELTDKEIFEMTEDEILDHYGTHDNFGYCDLCECRVDPYEIIGGMCPACRVELAEEKCRYCGSPCSMGMHSTCGLD